MEERHCDTCMHETLPSGIAPCNSCTFHNEWKPKVAEPAVGIDPGAPEGDTTNVRLDWGEIGSEMIGQKVGIDDDKRGPVVKSTGIPMGFVIGYAIDGIRGRASHLGLLLTDKTISVDALANTILELQSLYRDWETLEDSLAAIREAVEHVKDRDS